jgi:hypothetical protein
MKTKIVDICLSEWHFKGEHTYRNVAGVVGEGTSEALWENKSLGALAGIYSISFEFWRKRSAWGAF